MVYLHKKEVRFYETASFLGLVRGDMHDYGTDQRIPA